MKSKMVKASELAKKKSWSVKDHIPKYEWRKGMGEISGFGGGYEDTCRAMLIAALDWKEKHPKAEPYGIMIKDNPLDKVIMKAANDDCTGAMHHAVVNHFFFIQKNGWEEYCKKMTEKVKR